MNNNVQELVKELNKIVGEDVYLFSESVNTIRIYTNKNKNTNNKLINFNTDLNDYEINLKLNKIRMIRKKTFYIDLILILFFGLMIYYFFYSYETFINGKKLFKKLFFIVFFFYISIIYYKKFETIYLINKAIKKYFK